MSGEIVVARTFGGKPLRRRVWEVSDAVVYLVSDRQYELLKVGKPALQPIGFPLEDIFGSTAQELSESIDWSMATPWQAPGSERPRGTPSQLQMFPVEDGPSLVRTKSIE